MNAIGGWNWHCDIYKANIVLLSCPVRDIPMYLRAAISDPTEQPLVAALLSESYGYGDLDLDDPPAARASCFRRDGFTVVAIWLNPNAGPAIVAHEAFHGAYYLLQRAGVRLTESSEEAFAYLLEWLARGIHACLDGSTPPAPLVTLAASESATDHGRPGVQSATPCG